MNNKEHWEKVYGTNAQDAVSWYAPHLETSLNLIHQAAADKDAAIIDIRGGEATLAFKNIDYKKKIQSSATADLNMYGVLVETTFRF